MTGLVCPGLGSVAFGLEATSAGPTTYPYFESDLLAYLNGFGLRVFPGRVPQKESLPAIYFVLISGSSLGQLSGGSGMAYGRYQIAVSSTDYDQVGQVSEQLRRSLQRVQFAMGSTWVFSSVPGNTFTRYADVAAQAEADDEGIHTKINEFTFEYQQSIPTF